jgi:cyclic pyranopterin phosphate synthase
MSLTDGFRRTVRYLRLSVTDACPMRCVYCRPSGPAPAATDDAALTVGEIEALVRHLVREHGLRKVRLTGGEPTARSDLSVIVRRVAAVPGLTDLAMTTNGPTLARQAPVLAAAGLRRVHASLDSLDPLRFHRMTGVGRSRLVVAGIDAALAAGLRPLKLNAVVVRGRERRGVLRPARVCLLAYNTCGFPRIVMAWQWARQQIDRGTNRKLR